jgi:NAD(P)-dependent dehydrogenase (short-subunit alcohol dehydrogenase family)
MRLLNRIAIVTGAASGIGLAIAKEFLNQGASVALSDTNVSALDAAVKSLAQPTKSVKAFEIDVSDESSVTAGVNAVQASFGNACILVNCAAAQTDPATITQIPIDDWNKAFAINVTGAFLMSRAVLPQMQAKGQGVIIHIASQLGSVGVPGLSAYCATKGALLQLTKTMALDHAKDNIRVNSLSPGATLTERLRKRYGTDEAASEALKAKYALGRLGTAEEIAKSAVFLASDDSSFMTGTDLVVDGGYLAQ